MYIRIPFGPQLRALSPGSSGCSKRTSRLYYDKPKKMNKTIALAVALLVTITANAQKVGTDKEGDQFKHPVLVKLIQGDGNIFRIGFLRHNDFHDIKEDANDPSNIYANFIDLADVSVGNFKDKCFVYFPLSNTNGEMLIVNRGDLTKLDMRYEQAMELIVLERGK